SRHARSKAIARRSWRRCWPKASPCWCARQFVSAGSSLSVLFLPREREGKQRKTVFLRPNQCGCTIRSAPPSVTPASAAFAAHLAERGMGQSSSQRQTWLASIDAPLAAAIAALPAVFVARHLPPQLLLPAIAAFAFAVAAGA